MLGLMSDVFGMVWADLNAYQKEKLEDAYDQSMCGANDNSQDENKLLYGGYEPIVGTITHTLERAGQHRLELPHPRRRSRPRLRTGMSRDSAGPLLRQHGHRQAPRQAHASARAAHQEGMPITETMA